MDVNEYKNKLIEFAQEAVRTRSYSDEEGNFAALIKKTMEELKYDEVLIDSVGNVVGKIGNGVRTAPKCVSVGARDAVKRNSGQISY